MSHNPPPAVPPAYTLAAPSTKASLYNSVGQVRQALQIGMQSYPLQAQGVAKALGLRVEQADFKTPGLRGAALPAQRLIILDEKLSDPHKNFYCAHEICHHLWHGSGPGAFRCYDFPTVINGLPTGDGGGKSIPATQNAYLEWQANEGAAELLVPMRILLPTLQKYRGSYENDRALRKFIGYLAHEFRVPRATIELRLESLKYEIKQYLGGIPLRHVAVLSDAAQRRRGIRALSLNELYLTRL